MSLCVCTASNWEPAGNGPNRTWFLRALAHLFSELTRDETATDLANHAVALLHNTAVHYFMHLDQPEPFVVRVQWRNTAELEIKCGPGPLYPLSSLEAADGRVHVVLGPAAGDMAGSNAQFDLGVLRVSSAAALLHRALATMRANTDGVPTGWFRGLQKAVATAKPLPGTALTEASGNLISVYPLVTGRTGSLYYNGTVLLAVVGGQLARVRLRGDFYPDHQRDGREWPRSVLSVNLPYNRITPWWYTHPDQVQIESRLPPATPGDTLAAVTAPPEPLLPAEGRRKINTAFRHTFKVSDPYRVFAAGTTNELRVAEIQHDRGARFRIHGDSWAPASSPLPPTSPLQGTYTLKYNTVRMTLSYRQANS